MQESGLHFKGRHFSATDPFGREWHAEFRWLQTGISIRHANTVDVKFHLSGEQPKDLVVALPHPLLLDFCRQQGQELSDGLCLKIAITHLKKMVENWEDMEKTIITLSLDQMNEAFAASSVVPAGV
jgi:hypothetical protein